jgi:hypothetical protein
MGDLIGERSEDKGLRGKFSYSYNDTGINPNRNKDAVRKNTPYYYQDFKENIQFILDHFQEPLLPRTISTRRSEGRQILIHDVNEIYQEFEKSKFIDCRISAFPSIENPVPNFIFIDLDDIHKNISLDKILQITLSNIKKRLGGAHTVLWTGNGYHIYQPINNSQRFEDVEDFKEFDNPDNRFLRFEKDYLSSGYADKANYPSLKSCLLRVPGSLNSKCIAKGLSNEESRIKILQRWDGKRPPVGYQIGTFYSYLISEREKDKTRKMEYDNLFRCSKPKEIPWIEKLLETPIGDHRKTCLWHILVPYLVNVKRVQESEVYQILGKWLDDCNKERKVNFNIKYTIKSDLKNVKDFLPISKANLKKDYPDLYEMIKD